MSQLDKFAEGQLLAATGLVMLQNCYAERARYVPFKLDKSTYVDHSHEDFPGGYVRGGDGFWVPVASLKAVVHYDPVMGKEINLGLQASVFALDHPFITETGYVTTTRVVSYDEATGIFETRNTLYKPKEI